MLYESPSILPVLLLVIPTAAAVVIFAIGRYIGLLREILALVGSAGALAVSLAIAGSTIRGEALIAFGRQLYADSLSAFVIVLVSFIGFLATIYSARYMSKLTLSHEEAEKTPHRTTEARLTTFHGWLMLFIATMLWACVSNNIIMLYVAVEASTIASGLLVAFYWDRRSLEAGYKYLMLLTVGITFSLFGCVLVYAAGSGMLGGSKALLLTDLRAVAGQFPTTTIALASAFLIVGFGTKAGIAPFHPWLPDAHAEAPTPVSAVLSGVMLKVAIYALVRTVSMFYPGFAPIAMFALGLGVFTLVLGDIVDVAQNDLKRMLAYSSVSQIGYVLMGFGIGTQLGIYAGLFHMLNHALAKSLLFLAVGAVMYSTNVRGISSLGGLAKRMPITSFCFFVGALAVSGIPPFNGFQSKLALFVAGADAGAWWAVIIAAGTSLITAVVLLKATRTVFWGKMSAAVSKPEVREAPASLCAVMLVLAAACLVIGIYPKLVYKPLNAAASMVQTIRDHAPDNSTAEHGKAECTKSRLQAKLPR